MKYGAIIGVILVIVDFVMDKAEKSILTKEVEKTQNELNAVKAQLFDMQQKSTPPTAASSENDTSAAPETPKKDQ